MSCYRADDAEADEDGGGGDEGDGSWFIVQNDLFKYDRYEYLHLNRTL